MSLIYLTNTLKGIPALPGIWNRKCFGALTSAQCQQLLSVTSVTWKLAPGLTPSFQQGQVLLSSRTQAEDMTSSVTTWLYNLVSSCKTQWTQVTSLSPFPAKLQPPHYTSPYLQKMHVILYVSSIASLPRSLRQQNTLDTKNVHA